MFGNLGEIGNLMKQAKNMKANMEKVKEEIAKSEFTDSSPGDHVTVTISGDFEIKKITIDKEALADCELLEDLVTCAVNNAINQAKSSSQEKMKDVTGGLDIPGLF